MSKQYNPKVSIIIPVYNGENYLKEAINSALGQTYTNIEIIVVNDGSVDKTEQIALSYGDKIKYFQKENGGVSTALNLGIKKMTGDYFSWLSHDDLYYSNKIEKQIDYISKLENKEVVLYSNYSFINGKSKPFLNPVIHNHEVLVEKPLYGLYRGCINGITLLIPKKCFEVCGEFDPKLRCTQDYDMWFKMIKKFDFIHMVDVLSKTRLHTNQDTNTNPRVISEGNKLWIKMVEDVSNTDKIKLENSIYGYYYEMHKFLLETPYDEAINHCQKKCDEIRLKVKEDLIDTKVSVIIPFYNRADELLVAIESVLKQTHKNIELLLVNDGSSKNIDHIISKYEKNSNIKFIHLDKNMGPSAARNYGIKSSTGEFIALLDSDDYFLPYKIEKQLLKMLLFDSIISHTSYLRCGNGKSKVIHSGTLTGNVIPELIYSCPIATPTVMMKRKYLVENNILYREDFKIGEDICFWLDILKNNNLLGIDEPLTTVNTNDNSAAYNFDKQLEGIKNILLHVLQDDAYKHENYAIVKLCEYLQCLYYEGKGENFTPSQLSSKECANCNNIMNSNSWKITKPLRFTKKWFRHLINK